MLIKEGYKVLLEDESYSIDDIRTILSNLRVKGIYEEYEIQRDIADILSKAGIEYQKEYKLGKHNRIDFLISGGIGIEVKKGKPNKSKVIEQLTRYTEFEVINSVILVIERSMDIPKEITGKPCLSFGLNKLWGITVWREDKDDTSIFKQDK